jgi:hypothetical protein
MTVEPGGGWETGVDKTIVLLLGNIFVFSKKRVSVVTSN